MEELLKEFHVGEMVKIRCHLGYSRGRNVVELLAEVIELISRVKVVVS